MVKEVSLNDIDYNSFISKEKGVVIGYLRKKFSVSDDDLEDIFQEASTALFLNRRDGKLTKLTNGSSLSAYFLKVNINQALKFLRKSSKTKPLFDDSRITNPNSVRNDKLDELYGFCVDTEEEDREVRLHKLVNELIDSMTDTCRNILKGYYWDDLSMATIADEYDFPSANAVKTQKYKCMKKYHSKFKELWEKIYG